jgi:hypothetical protein
MISLLEFCRLLEPPWAHSWVEIHAPLRLTPRWTRLKIARIYKRSYNHCMKLEWDAGKAALNLESHGVAFEDAALVFYDQGRIERRGSKAAVFG